MDKQTESLARQKFEERVRFHYQYPELDIEPEGSPCAGEYVNTVRQDEWMQWKSAWTASRESLVVELPKREEFESYPHESYMIDDDNGKYIPYAETVESLRAIGIRIKGEGV